MDVFSFLSYMVEEEHTQIDQLLDRITDTDLSLALQESGEVTIGDRFIHMIGAEYRMSTYLYQDPSDDPEFKVSAATVDGLRQGSQASKARHLLLLQNLSTPDLEKVWHSKVSGKSYSYKYLLYHFIEHLATHRGQLAMAINRMVE